MKNNKTYRLEELEAMSTQQLEEMLQQEVRKDRFNEVVVKQLLDILEEREPDDLADDVDVDAAWQQFQAQYAKPGIKESGRRSGNTGKWLARVAATAAVFCVIVFAAPAAVGAENIFTLIGQWTADIFEFFEFGGAHENRENVYRSDNPDLQQLYDAVAAQGITERIVPTWIPDGYGLVELEITKEPDKTYVSAKFKCNEQFVSIYFDILTDKTPVKYPKDIENATKYQYADRDHYILNNDGRCTVAWAAEYIECSIAADFGEDTLRRVIRSIYLEG